MSLRTKKKTNDSYSLLVENIEVIKSFSIDNKVNKSIIIDALITKLRENNYFDSYEKLNNFIENIK